MDSIRNAAARIDYEGDTSASDLDKQQPRSTSVITLLRPASIDKVERDQNRVPNRLMVVGMSLFVAGISLYLLYDQLGFFTKFEYGVEACVVGGPVVAFVGEILAVVGACRRWMNKVGARA